MNFQNQNPNYRGIAPSILAHISNCEQQYRQLVHCSTRCQLLQAYLSAAAYAIDNAAFADAYAWFQKIAAVAEEGVRNEPCFYSNWDGAVTALNYARFLRDHKETVAARSSYKKAAAYLEQIIDEKMENPEPNCNPAALLKDIYAELASLNS